MKRNSKEFDDYFANEPGSRFKEMKHGEVLPDGRIVLISDGYEDYQEEVESWQESTEIETIVAMYNAGNTDILYQKEGFFGDVAGLPKTYPEVVQMMYNAEENFKKLPVEIRSAFNNDLNQFIAQYGTDEFYKTIEEIVTKDKKKDAAASNQAKDVNENKE